MTEQQLDIKIIRLNTGEDIIASCLTNEECGLISLGNPMRIIVKRITNKSQAVLIMMPWLPLELIEEDLATINTSDVLTIVSPKPSFVEYYYTTVENYRTMIEEQDKQGEMELFENEDGEMDEEEISDEMMQEMFEMMREKKNNSIH